MKKFFKRVLQGFGLLVLAAILWFGIQWFFVDHSIDISAETTHWTEPTKENGLPDFVGIVLESQREGVTPQNNGAIPFWQALWPGDLSEVFRGPLAAELQMTPPPGGGMKSIYDDPTYTALLKLVLQRRGFDELAARVGGDDKSYQTEDEYRFAQKEVQDLDSLTRSQPWTADEAPLIAQWVAENENGFELLHEAAARPEFYNPSPTMLTHQDTGLIATLLPGVNMMREAERSLQTRAMQRIGEGRYNEAWDDIEAMCGLADHLAGEYTSLVEILVKLTCISMANEGVIQLVNQPDVPRPLLDEIQAYLSARPKGEGVADALGQFERMMGVDAIIHMSYGDDILDEGEGAIPVASRLGLVDWNYILRFMNGWYDRMAEAAAIPDHLERQAKYDELDVELKGYISRSGKFTLSLVTSSGRSELMGGILVALLFPAVEKATHAEDRVNTQSVLTRTAVALAIYRAEQGEYPPSLAELTPAILPATPVDHFLDKPLVYSRTDDGYLLYSLGPNGTDDGASNAAMKISKGYSVSAQNASAVRVLVGEPAFQDDPDLPDETNAVQNAGDLTGRIGQDEDDIPLRMPPVMVPWPIEGN